jgi:iron(III) transport system permease protein
MLAARGIAATLASRWSSDFLVLGLATLAVLAPLAVVLYQSLLTAPSLEPVAQLGLGAYRAVFADPNFRIALGTTALLASGMTAIAMPLGAAFAFLTMRTDLPARSWLEPLIVLPLFIPSLVLALGFAATSSIPLPAAVKDLIGPAAWELHSLPSLIVLAGLIHVPHVYLVTAVALRALDRDLEDAARSIGAGVWKVAADVSIPMVLPAILFAGALVFLLGFELFGLPLVLGRSQGILVLSTYLYSLADRAGGPAHELMAAVAVAMTLVALPLVLTQALLLRWARRSIPLRRKQLAWAPLRLGWGRWPAFFAVLAWLAITLLAPLAGLTLRSFAGSSGASVALGQVLTLEHYYRLLQQPEIVRSIINTLAIGVPGGAFALACYTVIAFAADRRPHASAYFAMAPFLMPPLAVGLALLWLLQMVRLAPLGQTPVSIWLGYTIVWLGLGASLVAGMLAGLRPELEQAARIVGASETRTRIEVTFPLLGQGLLAAWVLIFLLFAREYAAGLFLLAPGSETIGSLLVSLWQAGAADLAFALSVVEVVIIGAAFALALQLGVRRWLS